MDTQNHATETVAITAGHNSATIHPIPLSDLHVSPLNMRAEKKEPTIKRMAVIAANLLPTVREKGIQTPLIVRPNNTGFEIIAGRRRFYAARVIADEKGNFPNIGCDVREGLTDAEALEISLTENLAREDADELTYYEAFLSLTLKGRSVGEIARTYGKTEREVQQYLAIANLLPAIRELYRGDHLDAGDLRLLTMATKTQQRDWLKLFKDDEQPCGTDLKGWLFGGAAIRTKFALFDLAPFAKKITGDLFSEDSFFTDANTFWEAQDAAIAERRDQYLAAKWTEVVVWERGKQWPQWDFVKATKKDGGRVYIELTHTGEVRFHEGFITARELREAEKKEQRAAAKAKLEKNGKDTPARPAITQAMQSYLDLHRHAVVRLAVIAHPADALRLMIAHAIAASGNWRVSPDRAGVRVDAIGESLAKSAAQSAFADEAKAVKAQLAPALKGTASGSGISGRGCGDDDTTVKVFRHLLTLKDKEVARIAALVMAETLASGSAVTDSFGEHAGVETRLHWTPDATFFELLRDRASTSAMLAEVAGKKEADRLMSAKLKDMRAALAAAAAKSKDWCPGWMRFPAQTRPTKGL
ncbi:MAG TPA: ParB N-terminal domain-containing protein [Rhizomicrobium sp.]